MEMKTKIKVIKDVQKKKYHYFQDWLEKAEFEEALMQSFIKIQNLENNTMEIWFLSPNGLIGTGYSYKHKQNYNEIVNPNFENDSDKSSLIDEIAL
ncbi:MAG: hypothetical protein ACD_79C01515G0001 [uncultured bacterium]|nr:MAG: hypothetical protein ACD_79C01515G0001 [uncultured bacterium]